MPSVQVATQPIESVALAQSANSSALKGPQQSAQQLGAALYSITEQRSANLAPTLAAVANAAPALPLNRLDSFGAGTVVNTSA